MTQWRHCSFSRLEWRSQDSEPRPHTTLWLRCSPGACRWRLASGPGLDQRGRGPAWAWPMPSSAVRSEGSSGQTRSPAHPLPECWEDFHSQSCQSSLSTLATLGAGAPTCLEPPFPIREVGITPAVDFSGGAGVAVPGRKAMARWVSGSHMARARAVAT